MKKLIASLFALAMLASASLAEPIPPVKSFSSGNVTNAAAVATITSGGNNFAFIAGFEITYGGATGALCVNPTVTGVLGGTMTYTVCAPAGVALIGTPLIVEFTPPLKAAAVNTNIVVTLPALGAGNAFASTVAHGWIE